MYITLKAILFIKCIHNNVLQNILFSILMNENWPQKVKSNIYDMKNVKRIIKDLFSKSLILFYTLGNESWLLQFCISYNLEQKSRIYKIFSFTKNIFFQYRPV